MPDERGRVHYIKLLTEPTEEQKEIYVKVKNKCSTFKGKAYNSRENGVQKKKNAVNTKLFQKNAKVRLECSSARGVM